MNALIRYNRGGYSLSLTDGPYRHVSPANPPLGTCRMYIPPGNPAKGADVGARISVPRLPYSPNLSGLHLDELLVMVSFSSNLR